MVWHKKHLSNLLLQFLLGLTEIDKKQHVSEIAKFPLSRKHNLYIPKKVISACGMFNMLNSNVDSFWDDAVSNKIQHNKILIKFIQGVG